MFLFYTDHRKPKKKNKLEENPYYLLGLNLFTLCMMVVACVSPFLVLYIDYASDSGFPVEFEVHEVREINIQISWIWHKAQHSTNYYLFIQYNARVPRWDFFAPISN